MAHFAELDTNNIVLRVLSVDNGILVDENDNETEQKGIEFLKSLFGSETNWVQTSYNGKFRNKYACIGDWYDQENNMFISITN